MAKEYTIHNVKPFERLGAGRNLITALGFFAPEASADFRISLDHIVCDEADPQKVNGRFTYSDFNIQTSQKFSNFSFSLPHVVEKGGVTGADVLGVRRFGGREDEQAVMADMIATKQIEQYQRHQRTVELQQARSLFSNTVDLGVEGVLDVAAELGIDQGTSTAWDLTSLESINHPMKQLMSKRNALVKSLGALSNKVTGMFCFLGDDAFNALKYNDLVRDDYKYSLNPSDNPLVRYSEELEIFESIQLNNIHFLNVGMDSEIAEMVGTSGFLVPRFDADAGVMTRYYGPATRMTKIRGVAPYYSYSIEDDYGNVSVESEFSSLPVNKLPSAAVKFDVTI